jgi:uncharacterized repeat protein (TIGR01451 family)
VADLKVTITDGKGTAVVGTSDTYTIVVSSSSGSSTATGAVVTDSFPSGFTGVSYTATATGGAAGYTSAGSGNITDSVTLPGGSKITYKATGTIGISASGTLSNTVTVGVPAGMTDPNPGNNTATDTDRLKQR